MERLRPPLAAIVSQLLLRWPKGSVVPLDAVGEAVGAQAVTTEEIEFVFARLEAEGRTVGGEGPGEPGVRRLHVVLEAARVLRTELGRTPTRSEIVKKTGLSEEAVAHALALAAIMQR